LHWASQVISFLNAIPHVDYPIKSRSVNPKIGGADGFRRFHVKNSRQHAVFHALINITHPAADANAPLRLGLDP
jgi:hypothetical protein